MSQDRTQSTHNNPLDPPHTDPQPRPGLSLGQANNLYTVTVVEGLLPQVQEHQTLADLADFLRDLVNDPDKSGTFCAVFTGSRLFFSTGRIPYLLLDGNPIPLSDNDMSPNQSGIIGPTMSEDLTDEDEVDEPAPLQRPVVEQPRLPGRAQVEDLDADEYDDEDEAFEGDILDDWDDK